MNVAKWLLYGLLILPLAELTAFIAATAAIGFSWALALVVAGSFAGAMILRRMGGNHVARMRVILGDGQIGIFEAAKPNVLLLVIGFLLLIPGFITDLAALLLLIAPLRRAVAGMLRQTARANDGIVDLEPEQWRRVPDPALPRRESGKHGNA